MAEFEGPNASGPTGATGRGIIFVHMPERTTVTRIDKHCAVIAPAATGAGLMTASSDERRFALRHVIERITGQTAGITDARVDGGARGGITDCDVALPVHVDAGHPAE